MRNAPYYFQIVATNEAIGEPLVLFDRLKNMNEVDEKLSLLRDSGDVEGDIEIMACVERITLGCDTIEPDVILEDAL